MYLYALSAALMPSPIAVDILMAPPATSPAANIPSTLVFWSQSTTITPFLSTCTFRSFKISLAGIEPMQKMIWSTLSSVCSPVLVF